MKGCFASVVGMLISAGSAVADPPSDAERLFVEGQAAYDQGRYDDAIAAWQRSFELSRAPGLEYNIAQAHRLRAKPGDCADARARYESFVRLSEPSPQRSLAEQYIAELADCAADQQRIVVSPRGPRSHDNTARSRTIVAGALGATGAVLLATGIYFGHRGSSLGREITDACADGCDWSVEKDRDASGRRARTLGWTFGAIGVASVLGGAAVYWFGVHRVRVEPVVAGPRDAGAVMSWRTQW